MKRLLLFIVFMTTATLAFYLMVRPDDDDMLRMIESADKILLLIDAELTPPKT